jgi:hypothetical protein
MNASIEMPRKDREGQRTRQVVFFVMIAALFVGRETVEDSPNE